MKFLSTIQRQFPLIRTVEGKTPYCIVIWASSIVMSPILLSIYAVCFTNEAVDMFSGAIYLFLMGGLMSLPVMIVARIWMHFFEDPHYCRIAGGIVGTIGVIAVPMVFFGLEIAAFFRSEAILILLPYIISIWSMIWVFELRLANDDEA